MAGFLDLENNFAFYGAYHNNPINILIHSCFVWPNFFTSLVLLYFTPPLFSPNLDFVPPGILSNALVFNIGFFFMLVHAVYYIMLDKKSGTLAAFLCVACWVGASVLAPALGFSLGWKVVLVSQIFCFGIQFTSHGVIEKRKPALLDNFVQAYMTAPYFVLLEILQIVFNYEPYPGFRALVQAKTKAEIKKWLEANEKKVS